jgi:glycosyltransferase involved in cell wall biosynthesis
MSERPAVLIFRQELLPYSETFIPAQTRWIERYDPHFTGLLDIAGLSLPADRKLVLEPGRAASTRYKLFGSAPGFVSRLRAVRPALIHAHFEDGGVQALPLARALGIPLVTTFHGYDATIQDAIRYPNPLMRSIYLRRRVRLQQRGSLFIAVSDFIRRKVIARGYPAERVVTHYIGVDTDQFAPDGGPREEVVLFVGRLVEKKGCDCLIRAMAPILERRRELRLVIIGDGPQRAALEDLRRELGARGIEFRGAVDSSVIKREMARASVLAAPSITAASGDSEGLPIAICEAQAMGLPVVATHHAGIPEVVEDGATGFLAREKSVEELRAAIEKILGSQSLREAMGKAARERAVAFFSLRKQTAILEKIYDAAVHGGACSPENGKRPDEQLQQPAWSAAPAHCPDTVLNGATRETHS